MALTKVQKEGIETLINNNADNRVITGSGTANTLNGESNVVIDANGKLGIGIASPNQELHVKGSGTVAAFEGTGGSSFIGIKDSDDSTQAFIGVDGGKMKFQTSGSSYSDKLVIDTSGNVGIGTTSPTQKLTVLGGSADSTIGVLTGSDTNRGLKISTATENSQSDMLVQLEAHGQHSGQYEGEISLKTGGNHRLRVDKAGNVGIGTTSPSYPLDVSTSSGKSSIQIITSGTGANDDVFLRMRTGGNTQDCFIDFGDSDDQDAGFIRYNHSNNFISFGTNDNTEKMRISSSGHVGVGLTAPGKMLEVKNQGQTNISCCFMHADGSDNVRVMGLRSDRATGGTNAGMIEFFRSDGSKVGSIQSNGSSTSYNTSSDYRLKENVTSISDGITRLKTLKPSRFNFKDTKDITVDGFLAHEVTAVPEAVIGTKDQVATADDVNDEIKEGDPIYQSIDQSKLVPLLTAALQEEIAKRESLETRVAALEAG